MKPSLETTLEREKAKTQERMQRSLLVANYGVAARILEILFAGTVVDQQQHPTITYHFGNANVAALRTLFDGIIAERKPDVSFRLHNLLECIEPLPLGTGTAVQALYHELRVRMTAMETAPLFGLTGTESEAIATRCMHAHDCVRQAPIGGHIQYLARRQSSPAVQTPALLENVRNADRAADALLLMEDWSQTVERICQLSLDALGSQFYEPLSHSAAETIQQDRLTTEQAMDIRKFLQCITISAGDWAFFFRQTAGYGAATDMPDPINLTQNEFTYSMMEGTFVRYLLSRFPLFAGESPQMTNHRLWENVLSMMGEMTDQFARYEPDTANQSSHGKGVAAITAIAKECIPRILVGLENMLEFLSLERVSNFPPPEKSTEPLALPLSARPTIVFHRLSHDQEIPHVRSSLQKVIFAANPYSASRMTQMTRATVWEGESAVTAEYDFVACRLGGDLCLTQTSRIPVTQIVPPTGEIGKRFRILRACLVEETECTEELISHMGLTDVLPTVADKISRMHFLLRRGTDDAQLLLILARGETEHLPIPQGARWQEFRSEELKELRDAHVRLPDDPLFVIIDEDGGGEGHDEDPPQEPSAVDEPSATRRRTVMR